MSTDIFACTRVRQRTIRADLNTDNPILTKGQNRITRIPTK